MNQLEIDFLRTINPLLTEAGIQDIIETVKNKNK